MPNRNRRRRDRMDEQFDGHEGLDRSLLVVAIVYYSPSVIGGVRPFSVPEEIRTSAKYTGSKMAGIRTAIRSTAFLAAFACWHATIYSQELLEVPEPEKLVASSTLVKEVSKTLAKSHVQGSEQYVSAMLALAKSEDEPSRKYLLLKQLLDESISNGDIECTLQTIDVLATTFNVPRHRLRIEGVSMLLAKKKEPDARMLCAGLLISSIRDAIERRDFATATQGYKVGLRETPKDAKKQISQCFVKLKRILDNFESMSRDDDEFQRQLEVDENNAKANEEMGRYCVLVTGEIDRCMNYFSRSQNPRLQEIAALESMDTLSAEDQRKLGDLWWDFAESQPEGCRSKPQERAASWYLKCVDTMKGVDSVIVKSRIETASIIDRCQFMTHDLLSPKIKRRIQNGSLDEKQKRLVLNPSEPSFCQFFLSMSDEYDLEYKFKRRDGKYGLFFNFPTRGRAYTWSNGGHASPRGGFHAFNDPPSQVSMPNWTPSSIVENSPHTLLIKVRTNMFQCYLDGKCVSEVRDPFNPKIAKPNDTIHFTFTEPRLSIGDYWGTIEIVSAIVTEYR